jgi:hypothetical protein
MQSLCDLSVLCGDVLTAADENVDRHTERPNLPAISPFLW